MEGPSGRRTCPGGLVVCPGRNVAAGVRRPPAKKERFNLKTVSYANAIICVSLNPNELVKLGRRGNRK